MHRRQFIQTVIGAAGFAALPLKLLPEETAPIRVPLTYGDFLRYQHKYRKYAGSALEDVCHNWWANKEVMRGLIESGYPVLTCGLSAEHNGYRHVSFFRNDGTTVFEYFAPWELEMHKRANRNMDIGPCDCGARSFQQHDWRCKRSSPLAHELRGDWSRYRKI